MKEKCETCLYYNPLDKETGVCSNRNSVIGIAYNYQFCHLHKGNGRSTVKPRRICDFCERGKRMNSDEGEHDLRLVKLTPLPAINLTSGETAEKAEPPYYAMFLYDMDREGEAATFPVKFCPICGRKLVGE